MIDHDQRSKALAPILVKHFPCLSESEAANKARVLSGDLSTAIALQTIERSDRDPKKDIDSLEKAVKALGKAQRHIDELGWHGSKALPAVLRASLPDPSEFGLVYPESNLQAQGALSNLIGALYEALTTEISGIDPGALSVNSAFGEGAEFEKVKQTKPTETAAALFAGECATVFYELTGKRPTVRTEPLSGEAYGPFLDFVRAAFNACEITASPETWARRAHKDFSPQK